MLAGELFVALGKNIFFYIVLWRRGHGPLRFLTSNLDEQALLQGAGAQTGGVKVLYNLQYFFQLFGRSVDTGVDGEFVADTVQRFAQQAIVVQRADEIFGQFALVRSQVLLAELLAQGFIERGGVGERNFFCLLPFAAVVLLQLVVGDIVFVQIIA